MNELLKSIGRGFAGLLRFGGRDGRGRFWPYAVFVFGLGQIGAMAAMMPALVRMQRWAIERIQAGPDSYPATPFEGAPDLVPLLSHMILLGSAITGLTILLLAAAVTRRLHDCDRRAYWGLLPLPFVAAAAILTRKAIAGMAALDKPDMGPFMGVFLNNLVYLCALGWLIYLLVAPGTPGSNRFGPPPD